MKRLKNLFFPGWWTYPLTGIIIGLAARMLCGCTSAPVSEPKYPEYDTWWAGVADLAD